MKSSALFSIGRLAARFDLPTHVLRYWEDVGLLEPAERVSGRRYYDESHAARITMILRGKDMGLSLAQMREIMAIESHEEHKPILAAHRADLEAQIERLEAAKRLIDHAIGCPHEDFTKCAEFQDVARAAAPHTA